MIFIALQTIVIYATEEQVSDLSDTSNEVPGRGYQVLQLGAQNLYFKKMINIK